MRLEKSFAAGNPCVQSGRQDAALYGRPEARRYAEQIQANGVVAEVRRAGGNGWSATVLRSACLEGWKPERK